MGIHALPAAPTTVPATVRQSALRRRNQGGVVAILFAGYIWVWKKGALEWETMDKQ